MKLPFEFKGKSYAYAQGQPMGAFSSFPMMALTNHILIRIAGMRAGYRKYTRYAVLGDDLCLSDQVVDQELRKIFELLGVEISQKSYQGKLFNFASRYFIQNHKEITGYSVAGLEETRRS